MVAFADDFSAGCIVENLKHWWTQLLKFGSMFGYFPRASKCWLIVKSDYLEKAENIFNDSNINLKTEGKKHLGAVIGSNSYKEEYTTEKLEQLENELTLLSEIAKIDPQSAYFCFVSGFKNKFSYLMRKRRDASTSESQFQLTTPDLTYVHVYFGRPDKWHFVT